MPLHLQGRDDGSPCCNHMPLPKDAADDWEYRDIDEKRRPYIRTHSQDMPSCTRQRQLSDSFHQKDGCELQTEDPESAALFAPISQGMLAVSLCPGE